MGFSPINNFDYNNSKIDNTINNIDRYSGSIRKEQMNKINDTFKKTFERIKDEYGGKFDGKDKDLAPKNRDEKQLLESVTELESMLVNQMFKSMRSTLDKESDMLYGGMTEDVFSDMLYNEYSTTLSKTSNLGLAKQMYKQMLPLVREGLKPEQIDLSV